MSESPFCLCSLPTVSIAASWCPSASWPATQRRQAQDGRSSAGRQDRTGSGGMASGPYRRFPCGFQASDSRSSGPRPPPPPPQPAPLLESLGERAKWALPPVRVRIPPFTHKDCCLVVLGGGGCPIRLCVVCIPISFLSWPAMSFSASPTLGNVLPRVCRSNSLVFWVRIPNCCFWRHTPVNPLLGESLGCVGADPIFFLAFWDLVRRVGQGERIWQSFGRSRW